MRPARDGGNFHGVTVQIDEGIVFAREAVRFPVELHRPSGMRVDDPGTWPHVEGRLEYVGGRLLYMPPCADIQQDVAMDVAYALRSWSEAQRGFIVGGNEAGMLLGEEIRAADAAVWRSADATVRVGKLRRTAPVLAVEIAGQDEGESELRDKARWYLAHGVTIVWIVLPETREVVVVRGEGEARYAKGSRVAEDGELPGLAPAVADLFAQLDR